MVDLGEAIGGINKALSGKPSGGIVEKKGTVKTEEPKSDYGVDSATISKDKDNMEHTNFGSVGLEQIDLPNIKKEDHPIESNKPAGTADESRYDQSKADIAQQAVNDMIEHPLKPLIDLFKRIWPF